MIANVIEKDALDGTAAPRVITSDAQNERYISALLELEKKERLTAKEKEFAELLTVLIEAYEDEHHTVPGGQTGGSACATDGGEQP